MNIALVFNLVGVVTLFSSLFMLLPVFISLLYHGRDLHALGLSFVITFFAGLLMYFSTRNQEKVELKIRDGFAVVTISWLAMSFFGALPYIMSGVCVNFTDAYFEAMAGFTTTGSSVLSNLEQLPEGILLWRSLTQWMGGMGIIVFSLAILPMLGAGGMQLFKAEVPEIGVEKLRPRIIDMAKSLWYIYAGLTAVLAVLLFLAGMDGFNALCHAFTTMATGGFSTKSASVAHFQSALIDGIITVFMFLAGVNFSLHFYALRGNFSRYAKSSEFKFYCSVVLAATIIVTVSTMQSGQSSIAEALRYASFQVVSIITTTGFATADYELWPVLSQMLLLSLMFFGGIWGFLFLFILISVIATLIMTALGIDIITSASTVISSMANVGPALGDAGPTENYASIPAAGKWVLAFCMLVGRLEIYTVILLFMPMFWRK
jgi:trk system potassium uptake protein TrkH